MKNSSILRIEVTKDWVHATIHFSSAKGVLQERNLEIEAIDQNEQKAVFEAFIPEKNGSFLLTHQTTRIALGSGRFVGGVNGGEITFSTRLLYPCSKFLFKVKHLDGSFEYSNWFEVFQYSANQLEAISNETYALIPCFNAEKYIRNIALETVRYVKKLIIIDDGSTDQSLSLIKEVQKLFPEKVQIIQFEKNQGKGHGLLTGYKAAIKDGAFSALITLDADAQHLPSDIPYLAESIIKGSDLSIGTRLFRLMPFRSKFSNGFISFFLRRFYGKAPKDTQSGMRGFSKRFVEEIVQEIPIGGCYEFEFKVLLLALDQKKKIASIPIATVYIEKNRSSHFSPLKDSIKIIKVFVTHLLERSIKKIVYKKKSA